MASLTDYIHWYIPESFEIVHFSMTLLITIHCNNQWTAKASVSEKNLLN